MGFERMANEKVVQLEEYYVQQLKMQEDKYKLLMAENNKLNQELNNLKYQSNHDREQLNIQKKKNENNESKISAYNASFIELAEKLKQLNDDTKALRKDKDKQRK